jgi:hypothetical protein
MKTNDVNSDDASAIMKIEDINSIAKSDPKELDI